MPLERDVIAIDIEGGRTVYVTPLSAFAARAINQKGLELFPDPDPAPYEVPLPDAVIEGEMQPATNDPRYVELRKEVQTKRNMYMHAAILSMTQILGVTREELIATYKDTLEQLRQFSDLPEDDYVAALRTFVLKPHDYSQIVLAAVNRMPLAQEEIRDGMRIFRLNVQRRTAPGPDNTPGASDISEGEQVPAQQPAG
jgi:hypothetical protein